MHKLRLKHPEAHPERRSFPEESSESLIITGKDIIDAVKTFPNGSSGGLDGIRPQHLKDLVSCVEASSNFIPSLVNFTNKLIEGKCPKKVQPYLFGGNLIALAKKDGGVRPIAVGSVWRRLAAKCVNTYATIKLGDLFSPEQLGVGVKGGAEAAAHAARRYLMELRPGQHLMKLDFTNAFNTLRRDSMLEIVHASIPEIYNFVHLAYAEDSFLSFRGVRIKSSEGPQQGDPLGSLLFASTTKHILNEMKSPLVMGFLDDFSAGGDTSCLVDDLDTVQRMAREIGLDLNIPKCEIITLDDYDTLPAAFRDFRKLRPVECELLGAPLLCGPAMNKAIETRCLDLAKAADRLGSLASHDALLILKSSLSAPKLLYTLRSSPCTGHPGLDIFDRTLRETLATITNVDIDDFA